MNTLIHADIFFVIASVGFVLLAVLLAVALFNVIGILRSVRHISKKVETGVDSIGDDLVSGIRESGIYRMVFGRKRKSK